MKTNGLDVYENRKTGYFYVVKRKPKPQTKSGKIW